MRAYQIMPAEIKATGPKGTMLKNDVLEYIKAKKLVKGQRAPITAAPAEKATKVKKEAPKKASKASPVFDPNDPFQQTWTDESLKDGFLTVAQNIKH
jgi:hypothetical protein